MRRRSAVLLFCFVASLPAGCGGGPGTTDAVADEESAQRAYLGLDRAFDRAIDLGFAGFNAASSAQIPEQSDGGTLSGVMIVDGKTDQGASANKNMDLGVTLEMDYQDQVVDGLAIVYNGGPASLVMSFKGLPNANLTGSFNGTFVMGGDLLGDVTLDLDFSGTTEENPAGDIVRTPGSIHVQGTATSDYGVFTVDVML